MRKSSLSQSRFIVGLVLIALAVLLFVFGSGTYTTAGAVALGVLGLVSIAISKRG